MIGLKENMPVIKRKRMCFAEDNVSKTCKFKEKLQVSIFASQKIDVIFSIMFCSTIMK